MTVVHLRPASGGRIVFVATHGGELGGWTAECEALGARARGSTWRDLLHACAGAIDAMFAGQDEAVVREAGFEIVGYSSLPGSGVRHDLAFEIRMSDP